MKFADHLFRTAGACLLAIALFGGAPAQAQAVSNIATARWSVGEQEFAVDSNEVAFDVVARAGELTTFVVQPGGSEHALLQARYCGAPLKSARSGETTASVPLLASNEVRIGQKLVIRLDAPSANRDPAVVDRVAVRLTSQQGDLEDIVAIETAANSGLFFAAIDTTPQPPSPIQNDCQLSLHRDETISITAASGQPVSGLTAQMHALADPFGVVFSSRDGTPIDGARVTIVDDATGAPAQVFAFDGITPYPSTVISGLAVTDGSGTVHSVGTGEYRFPLLAFGRYRLIVEPPAPFSAPSEASPAELDRLNGPSGQPFEITDGSYGRPFDVVSVVPLRIDIPLDSPGGAIALRKSVSRDEAQPGDALLYRLTLRNLSGDVASDSITIMDRFPGSLRLSSASLRVDGKPAPEGIAPDADGHGFKLTTGPIAPGGSREITYALTIAADAPPGPAVNRATARAGERDPVTASATVRIRRDGIADRMTVIGRVTAGRCDPAGAAIGVPGVRVMLEDGSFAVTDATGRYHVDGVLPGTHVVRAIESTLPSGGRFIDCAKATRNAGAPDSRFVLGQGGSLQQADFVADLPEGFAPPAVSPSEEANSVTDQEAAGAGIDWFALGDGPDEILFPATGHNPRSPAIRVVARHRPGQSPTLAAGGRPVDPLAYEGTTVSPDGKYAISVWRGVRLPGATTKLTVNLPGAGEPELLEREVFFANTPMVARIVAGQSRLIADGVTPPVLAVQFLDRHGRPVHAGISGSFTLEGPYQSVSSQAAKQSRELSGFGASGASWIVEGDEGIALIELAPTMVSGALRARFTFADGETTRESDIEAWMEPGDQPWTLIGLVEGTVGARSVADNMERGGALDSDLGEDARTAFYAKGRILGRFLLTASYDSAKQKEDQPLLGVIDPAAYYTVYGDNTERLRDAASREKLYVRIESRAFYAMFGDFETGFDQTELARYQRTATGVKAEARVGSVQAQAFAAKIGARHRRDEFQGGGISGPYPLASRAILANSEVVAIEVRDRLRSEVVLDRRELVRFVDYDIDTLSGTITFAEPVLSRDPELNPRFVVVDYEIDELAGGEWNAGARATWTSTDERLRVGATAVTDEGDEGRTNLGAVDLRVRIGPDTELRAEAAASRHEGQTSTALSAEIEHHSGPVDLVAYARQLDEGYGVGQQNLAERGRRKIGADARLAVTESLSVVGSAWHDESLTDEARRNALEVRGVWRSRSTDAYLGLAHISDHLADGSNRRSTVLEAGATQRLFDQRLEVSAASSLALSGTDSIDLPTRHRLGARYALTPVIRLLGTYEIAEGDAIDSRTLQGGVEITPWRGGKIVSALGSQTLSDADRTFASVAFGQSFRVTEALTVDATIDGSRTLGGGIAPTDPINPHHPVASGGHLGESSLGEDFTALTLGAVWQKGRWSARVRGEYRYGETANRQGVTAAAIRQLGEGSVVGSALRWTKATGADGASSEIADAALSLAHRPAASEFAFLSKVEYRSDTIFGATTGNATPVGPSRLTLDGDARSSRVIGSVSGNWTPRDRAGRERGELGLFVGLRRNFDRFEGFDLADTTLLGGANVRVAVGERIEIGGRATVRSSLDDGATTFAIGPEIGFVPADNMLLSVGYNVVGFRDPDFAAARSTERGFFAAIKVKFDERSFEFLGLGQR